MAPGPEAPSPENLLEMSTSHQELLDLVLGECGQKSNRYPIDCDILLSLRTTSLERRKLRKTSSLPSCF